MTDHMSGVIDLDSRRPAIPAESSPVSTFEQDEWRSLATDARLHEVPADALAATVKALAGRLLEVAADNPSSVNLAPQPPAWQVVDAGYLSFPAGVPLYVAQRVVWWGKPGTPDARPVADLVVPDGADSDTYVALRWRWDDQAATDE